MEQKEIKTRIKSVNVLETFTLFQYVIRDTDYIRRHPKRTKAKNKEKNSRKRSIVNEDFLSKILNRIFHHTNILNNY